MGAYTALYRKFRPTTFSEIVGQEHITKTIRNQIVANRVGHAYLFNGGRGTGKTSAAKVLARVVNCLNPKEGEPCNECEICKSAIEGSLTDIVEMDAASNNSVEDIRGIREAVNFLPTKAKYRVYIIDEVHMLSVGAFNALLKTLEEPPEHVKFILATTEPQKIPATILSRCQRFDFKRISNDNIVKRLKIVCDESKIEATEEALYVIAALSEGAMRDALSILERCLQDGENNINSEKIKELVGIPPIHSINKIVKAIINYDVNDALSTIETVLNEGKDLNNLLWEIIKYIKDILIFKASKTLEIYNKEEIEAIKELSEEATKERLIKLIYDLSEFENDIKLSSQKLIMFQTGIIKLCNKENMFELEARIAKLEKMIATSEGIAISKAQPRNRGEVAQGYQGVAGYVLNAQGTSTAGMAGAGTSSVSAANKVSAKIQTSVPKGKLQEYWPNIVNDFKKSGKIMLYTNLINTTAYEINDMTIGIQFPNGMTPFGKTVLEKAENINEISKQISMACGKTMNVKYFDNKPQEDKAVNIESNLESFAKEQNIPFNIID